MVYPLGLQINHGISIIITNRRARIEMPVNFECYENVKTS